MGEIRHTKRYVLLGGGLLLAAMLGGMEVLERAEELPYWLEAGINLMLACGLAGLILCLVLLVRDRPVLRAGERGLYLRVSRNHRGVVPWKNVEEIGLSGDRRGVLLFLRGTWDDAGEYGERFDIRTGPGGRRALFLPLKHKVAGVERACAQLRQWHAQADGGAVGPAAPEAGPSRRGAAWKGRGVGALRSLCGVLLAKYWLLGLLCYLLAAGGLAQVGGLEQRWALLAAAPVCLPVLWLARRLLKRLAAWLKEREDSYGRTSVGL